MSILTIAITHGEKEHTIIGFNFNTTKGSYIVLDSIDDFVPCVLSRLIATFIKSFDNYSRCFAQILCTALLNNTDKFLIHGMYPFPLLYP